MKTILYFSVTLFAFLFSGCMSDSKQMILDTGGQSQVELRSYQTRTYDASKEITAKAATATLQDLGFVIDKADFETGTLTATKISKNSSLKMTIVIRTKGKNETIVRANGQYAAIGAAPSAIEDPNTYQTFFSALDKSIFLAKEGL